MALLSRFNTRTFVFLALITSAIFIALIYKREDHYGIPSHIQAPHFRLNPPPPDPPPNPDDRTEKWIPGPAPPPLKPSDVEDAISRAAAEPHVIDELVRRAEEEFQDHLSKETKGVQEAANVYWKRRGRAPPPRFDEWVAFAEENNALIIEDHFDQIYADLNPFWSLNPLTMRDAVLAWPYVISVRKGNASYHSDNEDRPWMNLWTDMVSKISHLLPDLDFAVNEMDESRILVPWEAINHHMAIAEDRRIKNPFPTQRSLQVTDYQARGPPDYAPEKFQHGIVRNAPIWSLAREACPPTTPARTASFDYDVTEPPSFPAGWPNGSYQGFVSNWTYAKHPCLHPHLRGLHGSFVEPLSFSSTQTLFPLFGGSKLPVNNEILIPAAMYWTEDEFYSGGNVHVDWSEKSDGLIWRGTASGGRNRLRTWARFQRHRFISMMNGTHIRAAQIHAAHANQPSIFPALEPDIWMYDFPLPNPELYEVSALEDRHLGAWVDSFADAAFVNMECFPREGWPGCSYTSPFFALKEHVHMREQYHYKYLPDLDGNSFSGRYRGFLRSHSLPLKGTVYSEWHDSRLFAWKHFVPLDNTYKDFWSVMQYFLGYDPAKFEQAERELGWMRNENDTDAVAEGFGIVKPAGSKQEDADAASNEPALSADSQQKDGDDEKEEMNAALEANVAARQLITPTSAASGVREKVPGHDAVAQYIAQSGHEWAERVLRKEDMLVYMYRLLLEYARVCSEERDRMGWASGVLEEEAGRDSGDGDGVWLGKDPVAMLDVFGEGEGVHVDDDDDGAPGAKRRKRGGRTDGSRF